MNEDDSDWAASEGDQASDEEADGTYKPQYAFWAEKGTWKAKSVKGPGSKGAAGATPALNRQKGRQQVTATFSTVLYSCCSPALSCIWYLHCGDAQYKTQLKYV